MEAVTAMNVEKVLMTGEQKVDLYKLKEKAMGAATEILQAQEEIKKRRKAKRKNDSCLDASSESENEADGYFRGKADLQYANLEWRDIKQTTLGRKINEKINMLLGDRKHLQKRIETMTSQHRI